MTRTRQLIVVANRLPIRRVTEKTGRKWVTSPGGLVTALAPVMAGSENAVWIGWTGATGSVPEPFEHDGLQLHPVPLSRAEVQQYYEGFSNAIQPFSPPNASWVHCFSFSGTIKRSPLPAPAIIFDWLLGFSRILANDTFTK